MIIDEKIVDRLVEIVRPDDVDWNLFNSVLDEIDDINAVDENSFFKTYLSVFMWHHTLYKRGDKYRKIIKCFVDHGYDMSSYAVGTLFNLPWTSYDKNVLDVAKDVFNLYVTPEMLTEDDWNYILDAYGTKYNGAWCVDNDYEWANVMGALIELVCSAKNGKDVNKVFSYHKCFGKTLTSVCAPKNNAVYRDRNTCRFENELVFCFGDLPLYVFEGIDFVVDGNEYSDNKYDEILEAFDNVIGAKLVDICYFSSSSCTMLFDNGYHINFSSVGEFEILKQPELRLDEALGNDYCDDLCENADEDFCFEKTEDNGYWFDTKYGSAILFTADGKSLNFVSCSDYFRREFLRFPEIAIDSMDVYTLDDEISAICVLSKGKYLLISPSDYQRGIVFTKITRDQKYEMDELYKSMQ